jgi:hypothetical protein
VCHADERLGFALLDSATALIQLGAVRMEPSSRALCTLLMQTAPSEVLHVRGNLPTSAERCLNDPSLSPEITVLAPEEVPAPAAALASLDAQADFQAIGVALKAMREEVCEESVSALLGLLSHIRRMKLLPILSSSVQACLPCLSCNVVAYRSSASY